MASDRSGGHAQQPFQQRPFGPVDATAAAAVASAAADVVAVATAFDGDQSDPVVSANRRGRGRGPWVRSRVRSHLRSRVFCPITLCGQRATNPSTAATATTTDTVVVVVRHRRGCLVLVVDLPRVASGRPPL